MTSRSFESEKCHVHLDRENRGVIHWGNFAYTWIMISWITWITNGSRGLRTDYVDMRGCRGLRMDRADYAKIV